MPRKMKMSLSAVKRILVQNVPLKNLTISVETHVHTVKLLVSVAIPSFLTITLNTTAASLQGVTAPLGTRTPPALKAKFSINRSHVMTFVQRNLPLPQS